MMILDFDRPVWIVQKFGPYEFQPLKKKQDAINPTEDYKTRVPQPFLPSRKPARVLKAQDKF